MTGDRVKDKRRMAFNLQSASTSSSVSTATVVNHTEYLGRQRKAGVRGGGGRESSLKTHVMI